MPPQKILGNIVILCFERRFSKQNSVIRLKLNISVCTAEYCLYIFLFLGSGGGPGTVPPLRTLVLATLLAANRSDTIKT